MGRAAGGQQHEGGLHHASLAMLCNHRSTCWCGWGSLGKSPESFQPCLAMGTAAQSRAPEPKHGVGDVMLHVLPPSKGTSRPHCGVCRAKRPRSAPRPQAQPHQPSLNPPSTAGGGCRGFVSVPRQPPSPPMLLFNV